MPYIFTAREPLFMTHASCGDKKLSMHTCLFYRIG